MLKSFQLGFTLALELAILFIVGLIIWCYLKPNLDKFCDWLQKILNHYE